MITLEDILALGWIERTDAFYIEKVLPRDNYRCFSIGSYNLEWWTRGRGEYGAYSDMNVCTSVGKLPLLIFDSKWHNITTIDELRNITPV